MSDQINLQKSYFAPGEVADMLMVSPATVRNWASNGKLLSVMTAGGHRRFMRHDVERFARQNNLTIRLPDDDTIRILIVDDDIPVATYLSRFLAKAAAPVVTMQAHDGYTAGRLVQSFRPNIVLLDLMMPGLNGYDVCTQLKSDPTTKATRVIAMTGFHDEENVRRALSVGAEHCILKPLDEQELLKVLGLNEYSEKRGSLTQQTGE